MMTAYRKKTGVGRSAPPAGAQGGAMPQKGNPQRGGVVNMMGNQGPSGQGAPAQGTVPGPPNPQQLQKIFDIARTQGPQAVQQYVAQAHGPQAAQALAAHPDVQRVTSQLGRMPMPGAEPNDSFGGGGPATPGAPTPQSQPTQGPLAPRYQQMIAAGQDPAAVAARAAQFRAGGLPGQQGAGSPSGPPMAQPVHTMPAQLPNPGGQGAPSFGGGQSPPLVNAGAQIPGVMAPGAQGGFTKPFQPGDQPPGADPNDMRSMLAQRLRGMPLGYNAGGQNYQA